MKITGDIVVDSIVDAIINDNAFSDYCTTKYGKEATIVIYPDEAHPREDEEHAPCIVISPGQLESGQGQHTDIFKCVMSFTVKIGRPLHSGNVIKYDGFLAEELSKKVSDILEKSLSDTLGAEGLTYTNDYVPLVAYPIATCVTTFEIKINKPLGGF